MKGIRKFLILTLSLFMMFSSCLMVNAEGDTLDENASFTASQNENGDLVLEVSGNNSEKYLSAVTDKSGYIGLSLNIDNQWYNGTITNKYQTDITRTGNSLIISKQTLLDRNFYSGKYIISIYASDAYIGNGNVEFDLNLDRSISNDKASKLNLIGNISAPKDSESTSLNKSEVYLTNQNSKKINDNEFAIYWSDLHTGTINGEPAQWWDKTSDETFVGGKEYKLTVRYAFVGDYESTTTLSRNDTEFKIVNDQNGCNDDTYACNFNHPKDGSYLWTHKGMTFESETYTAKSLKDVNITASFKKDNLIIEATGSDAKEFISNLYNGEVIDYNKGYTYNYISLVHEDGYSGYIMNEKNISSDGSVAYEEINLEKVNDTTLKMSKEKLAKAGFINGDYTLTFKLEDNINYPKANVSLTTGITITPNRSTSLNVEANIKEPVGRESTKIDTAKIKVTDASGNEIPYKNDDDKVGYTICWTEAEKWGDNNEYTYYRETSDETFELGKTYYLLIDYYWYSSNSDYSATAIEVKFNDYDFENVSNSLGRTFGTYLNVTSFTSFVSEFTPTTSAKVVAKIGNTGYASLQDAINKASSGQTIVLQDNITVDTLTISGEKTITLNMNGKTITQDYSGFTKYKCLINVLNGANLTITGNGKFVGPAEDGAKFDAAPLVMAEGEKTKLTILNGTFTAGGKYDCGMYGVYSKNGGTIILGDKNTKTGPTIHTQFAAIGENNTTSPAYITIYGGEYTTDVAPTNNEWWYYFCAPIYASSNGSITIEGGTFNGYYGISSRYSNVNQTINISGGTFNTTKETLLVEDKTGSGVPETISRTISISGGVFSSDITNYLAKDSDIAKVGTKYAVSKKNEELPKVEVSEITPTIEEKATKQTLIDATVKADKEIVTIDNSTEIILESSKKTEADIKDVKETIKDEVVKKVTEESKKVETNSVGLIPLDVTLKVKNGTDEKTITELSKPITVTLYLDEDTLDKLDGKIVKVVRIHKDAETGKEETTVLDTKLVNNALSFKTDKFSTYVIAYTTTISNNTNTNTSTKSYDAKDKNKDGVISCEEEMNSANWIWSTTKNACVYKVTNTSAK